MDFKVKKYRPKENYSYTLGMAPTIELIENKKSSIYKIIIHPDYRQEDDINIFDICERENIDYEVSENTINRISNKGNVYVAGVFYKYESELEKNEPHILLVNPSNAGNLGTILRSSLGFGFLNIAIVTPAVDIFNPNVIRSSMGALFSLNFEFFENVDDYLKKYDNKLYSFMLNGEYNIKKIPIPEDDNFTLVFGNEATGLPDRFLDLGESLYINHSEKVDSLNLAIAFGIAANHFSKY